MEPAHDLTPEKLFERQWAIAVLDQVLARLQAEFAAEGKQAIFERLKPFLTAGRQSGGYAQVAAELGMTEGAVKMAVHRLRRRYRQLVAGRDCPNGRQPGRNRRRNPVSIVLPVDSRRTEFIPFYAGIFRRCSPLRYNAASITTNAKQGTE